jgi:hypothetical protein
MARRTSYCQYTMGRTFFICAAIWCGVIVAAQERSKAELEAITLARETLAAKLSVPLDRLKTVSASSAQWRDSSLGCPERGMVYTPALVAGYAVTLREGEREYVVHVAGGRAIVCGSQSDRRLPPEALIATPLKAADAVRRALAARLGIEPAGVRVTSTRSFRSPPPCPAAPTPPGPGALLVEAEAAAQSFRYYADDKRVVSCDEPAQTGPTPEG